MEKKPKSGKVIITLGPTEVKQILENPTGQLRRSGYGSRYGTTVDAKLYKAAAEKFSNVAEDMEEELKARNICYSIRDSDAWKTLRAGYGAEHKAIDAMFRELSRKEAASCAELVQQEFAKAGITTFEARGYGFGRVVQNDSN